MKVTLADVARRIGASPSTVQRALNNLGGVGRGRREEIQRVAEEMGYRRNLTASALKTGVRTVAVVLPDPARDNRFYAKFLWEGALRRCAEYRGFNLDVAEFTYVRTPAAHVAALRDVLENRRAPLAGLLTMGVRAPGAKEVFAGFRERGVPVVFVGTDADEEDRVCCVRSCDEMAGRMAADLLINFTSPEKGAKVVMTGDFAIPDQFHNALGFERRVHESALPVALHKLPPALDLGEVKRAVSGILAEDGGVHAVYATSSRNTVPVCEAAEEAARARDGRRRAGAPPRIIGSDVFAESADFLRRGVLSATIHKRPADQAGLAAHILVDIVVKGAGAPEPTVLVDPVIVMGSNAERFA